VDSLTTEISEFLEQIDYALSFEFRDKWKHRFSTSFVSIFQQKLISALKRQKPFKLTQLTATYMNKYGYKREFVEDFYKCINVRLYRPLVIDDRR
tara:strand:- start:426 stop:710 length:285 start_codon:yes stop_codon:yes gene_type:complete